MSKILVIGLLLFSSGVALADEGSEIFRLGAAQIISKCQDSGEASICGSSMPMGADNVEIVLDNCSSIPGSFSTCSGQWQGGYKQDGYGFISTISVTKTVMTPNPTDGQKADVSVSYRITAQTGPEFSSQPVQNSIHITLGRPGGLTDSVELTGEQIRISGAGVSYQPTLIIGPANFPTVRPQSSRHSTKR